MRIENCSAGARAQNGFIVDDGRIGVLLEWGVEATNGDHCLHCLLFRSRPIVPREADAIPLLVLVEEAHSVEVRHGGVGWTTSKSLILSSTWKIKIHLASDFFQLTALVV